jgi:hypothetical protein
MAAVDLALLCEFVLRDRYRHFTLLGLVQIDEGIHATVEQPAKGAYQGEESEKARHRKNPLPGISRLQQWRNYDHFLGHNTRVRLAACF